MPDTVPPATDPPNFFKPFLCVSRCRPRGYFIVGHALGRNVAYLVTPASLARFVAAAAAADPIDAVWHWLGASLPASRALIPPQHRENCVVGIIAGYHRELADCLENGPREQRTYTTQGDTSSQPPTPPSEGSPR